MPKLLLFAPCEKVIIDRESGTASLITILQDVTVSIPPDVQLPEKAAVPLRWYVFTVWHKQPGEEGKRFAQEIELSGPDGSSIFSATSQFEMADQSYHRVTSLFSSFPVWQSGWHTLKLYLSENKEGEERREVASFPLNVIRSLEAVSRI
jgi:hypothetical protein